MKHQQHRILFYCLPGIGDALMMTPALKILRENFPQSEISVLTMHQAVFQIVNGFSFVDYVYLQDFFRQPFYSSLKFVFQLRRKKFHITMMGFPANRLEYSILSWIIGGKRRLGHKNLLKNYSSLHFLYTQRVVKNKNHHNVVENVKLSQLAALKNTVVKKELLQMPFLSQELIFFAKKWIQKNTKRDKIIGIHAGCSVLKNHIHRRWPKESFKSLVEKLTQTYAVFIFGGPEEENLKQFVAGNQAVVVKGVSFLQSAAIIKHCTAFVSNDSGLMHLAASFDCLTVGIFGPTNPTYVSPYCKNFVVIKTDLECAPCFEYSKKPLECKQYGDYRCLKEISPQLVFEKLTQKINSIE